jgi:hypothetical protein
MSHEQRTSSDSPQEATSRTVVGLFGHRTQAEAAIRELQDAGFPRGSIGVAMRDRVEQGDLLQDAGSDAAAGAATGAVSGGLVGGLIGLLGSLLIPGLGPVVVGGVLASTLTAAGVGAVTGGLLGVLVGLGVPEEDARHFDNAIRSGGTLVTVDAGARTSEALEILGRHEVDLGPSADRRVAERRVFIDPEYAGPERRMAGV